MRPLSRLQKEGLIMAVLLFVMTAKIFFMVRLLHRWRLEATAEGRPFGDAEES